MQIVLRGAQRLCATRAHGGVPPRGGDVRAIGNCADKVRQAFAVLVTARQENPAPFSVQEVGFCLRVVRLFCLLPCPGSALVAQSNPLTKILKHRAYSPEIDRLERDWSLSHRRLGGDGAGVNDEPMLLLIFGGGDSQFMSTSRPTGWSPNATAALFLEGGMLRWALARGPQRAGGQRRLRGATRF